MGYLDAERIFKSFMAGKKQLLISSYGRNIIREWGGKRAAFALLKSFAMRLVGDA